MKKETLEKKIEKLEKENKRMKVLIEEFLITEDGKNLTKEVKVSLTKETKLEEKDGQTN